MSDYTRKSALVEKFEERMKDDNVMCPIIKVLDVLEIIEDAPTLDETEIIRKAFERVLARLEENIVITWEHDYLGGKKDAFMEAIKIIKEECEISEISND